MGQVAKSPNVSQEAIKVTKDSLPACCPPDNAEVWNQHPRVYLAFDEKGRATCPYCGTPYQLEK